MDGRSDGIQMTPLGGGPKYQQNSPKAGHSSVLCLFCTLRNFSDWARLEMLQTDFRREMGCSGSFVDLSDLVMGYVMGYLPTISENKFVLVRLGASEHEIDKHPLRLKTVLGSPLESQIPYP